MVAQSKELLKLLTNIDQDDKRLEIAEVASALGL